MTWHYLLINASVWPLESGPNRNRRWLIENWSFNADQLLSARTAMTILGLLVALVLVLWLWRWYRQRAEHTGPIATFQTAAVHFGLNWQDRWLLIRISLQQNLPSPITLMLSSATLEHHAHGYVESVSPKRRQRVLTRIDRISRQLFGTSAEG